MNTQQFDQGNGAEVLDELNRRFPELGLSATDSGLPPEDAAASRAAKGKPIIRTYFWGFHIEVSSQGLDNFLSVAQPVNLIVAAIGPVTGPAAPFVLAAAGFIAGALKLLKNLDHGQGVYISMSWMTPGVFIPTTVTRKRALAT
jgi:hypothetical protein